MPYQFLPKDLFVANTAFKQTKQCLLKWISLDEVQLNQTDFIIGTGLKNSLALPAE